MLNNGYVMIGEILEVGKKFKNMKGIRLDPRSMSKKDTNHSKKLFPPKNKNEFQMLDHKAQQPVRHVYPYNGNNTNYNRIFHQVWKLKVEVKGLIA